MESVSTAWKFKVKVVAAGSSFLGMVAIFYLPQLFPTTPSISDSYLFGYNNRLGTLLLLLLLLAIGYYCPSLQLTQTRETTPVSRRYLHSWLLIFIAGWGIMFFLTQGLRGFGESAYLIDRVNMLAAGGSPYKGFEFAYGPFFLYAPRALMFLHLSAETSYYIVWLLSLLGGVLMLAKVLERVRADRQIFSMVCLFALISVMTTGMNYSLFRFIAPAYFAVFIGQVDRIGVQRRRAAGRWLTFGATVILLLISPEISLSFAIGIVGYYLVFDWRSWRGYLFTLLLEGCIFWVAARLGIFSTLKMFAGGAYNFPIIPSGHLLLLFFMCGLAALYAANRLRSAPAGDDPLIVLAVSIGMLPAALGRCDPIHVGFSAIGIVIVASVLASSMKYWKVYRWAFLTFFFILPGISLLWSYKPLLSKAVIFRILRSEPSTTTNLDRLIEKSMARSLGEPQARSRLEMMKFFNADSDLGTEPLFAPFGYSPNHLATAHPVNLATGYFDGLDNAFTPKSVATKIHELKKFDKLLIPNDFSSSCTIIPKSELGIIRVYFFFPYSGKARHDDSIWKPLCSYISANYHELKQVNYGYEIWSHK